MEGRVTIFPSGKMISVGAKSISRAYKNFRRSLDSMLRNCILRNASITNLKIRNIVATVNFDQDIDLNILSMKIHAIYEPEQFSGLIYKLPYLKTTILLFSSGEIIRGRCFADTLLENKDHEIGNAI